MRVHYRHQFTVLYAVHVPMTRTRVHCQNYKQLAYVWLSPSP